VPWTDLLDVAPGDYTIGTVPRLLQVGDPWTALMPPPQVVDPGLVEQGHTIPVARVAAMHEGKRRKREARQASAPEG
jgi:hypothetical protein